MYNGKVVLSKGRNTSTGLWLLSIAKKDTGQQERNVTYATLDLQMPRTHSTANIGHMAAASM